MTTADPTPAASEDTASPMETQPSSEDKPSAPVAETVAVPSRRTTAEAYSARELALIKREEEGNLEFVYLQNDGSDSSMIRCEANSSGHSLSALQLLPTASGTPSRRVRFQRYPRERYHRSFPMISAQVVAAVHVEDWSLSPACGSTCRPPLSCSLAWAID
jgi:hypothetical protein